MGSPSWQPSPPGTGRWFGVGSSSDPDPVAGGAQAVRTATTGGDPTLVIVFASIDLDVRAVLDGVRGACPGHPTIVGCSTGGQLSDSGAMDSGVAVVALGGPGFQVASAIGRRASDEPRAAGALAAACMSRLDRPHQVLVLLSDHLIGQQHDMVRGAYSEVGATVPLVGGCAAERAGHRSYQFYGDPTGVEVTDDVAIGVAIGSDAPLGLGIAHGWHKLGDPVTATRSTGGQLYELDGRPALDVYLARTGIDPSLLQDPVAFRSVAYGHPLGMSRRSGEDIRVIHDVDPDQGTLRCLADVPQGAITWFMRTDPDSLVGAAAASCTQALTRHPGPPIGALLFDCGARKEIMGPAGIDEETTRVRRLLGDVPFAGFYTYGEIARVHGARGMHHMTVVSLALW